MKAIIATQYGSPEVLSLREAAKPVPGENDILVKIHATTVTAGDSRSRSFNVPRSMWLPARLTLGLTRPRKAIPGMVLSGEVEAVGSAVEQFRPGDLVYAYDITRLSTYAEYACVPKDSAIGLKPSTVSHEEAAAIPFGAITALYFLRKAGIRKGQQVLINGASGSVGTAAVQLAKGFGATVTGISSGRNADLVTELGADHFIDYTREDFRQNGQQYDIIFDAVGKISLSDALRWLKPGGAYLQAVAGPKEMIQMKWASRKTDKSLISGTAYPTAQALNDITELVQAGTLRAVIDRCYPLEGIVEAHRYVDQGHKRGNVVITIGTGR